MITYIIIYVDTICNTEIYNMVQIKMVSSANNRKFVIWNLWKICQMEIM